jgi:hypothetical protein
MKGIITAIVMDLGCEELPLNIVLVFLVGGCYCFVRNLRLRVRSYGIRRALRRWLRMVPEYRVLM